MGDYSTSYFSPACESTKMDTFQLQQVHTSEDLTWQNIYNHRTTGTTLFQLWCLSRNTSPSCGIVKVYKLVVYSSFDKYVDKSINKIDLIAVRRNKEYIVST